MRLLRHTGKLRPLPRIGRREKSVSSIRIRRVVMTHTLRAAPESVACNNTVGGFYMGFVKCPRCELNYMQDDEQYCSVCKREVKGESKDELFELCSVCSENPVYPGKDLCLFCLKEMGKSRQPTSGSPPSRTPQRTS